MKKLIIIIALLLVGCSTPGKPEKDYVIRIMPSYESGVTMPSFIFMRDWGKGD